MDVVDELLGRWLLVARGHADRGGDDSAAGRDVGMVVRFRPGDRDGVGVVDLEVGRHTYLYGVWRANPTGLFLGSTGGYSAAEFDGEAVRRGWLDDAVGFSTEAGELVLWDRAEQVTARFDRVADTHRPATAVRSERAVRLPVGLPTGLVALEGGELVGAWQPVQRPQGLGGRHGARFQNVEFTALGYWIPSPRINIGSGRWLAGRGGALLAVYPELGRTDKAMEGWVELDPWLLPVARAGFDGPLLVLFDDHNHELQRLRRLDSRLGSPDKAASTG